MPQACKALGEDTPAPNKMEAGFVPDTVQMFWRR